MDNGHERRANRQEERRARRQHRRLVLWGDSFTSDELERGEVELQEVEPDSQEPEWASEPWGWTRELPPDVAERLALYLGGYSGSE